MENLFDKPIWQDVKQIILLALMQGDELTYKQVWKKISY